VAGPPSVDCSSWADCPYRAVNGIISVPCAGFIRAKGRTQVEVQRAIVDTLKNQVIEPQSGRCIAGRAD
jgi:hypothetical protein